MKSIRLSLIVYFLLLLAAGLGAASALAYRTATQSLSAQLDERREFLTREYQESRKGLGEKFDAELFAQARTVASLVQSQNQVSRSAVRLTALGLLNAGSGPYGHITSVPWMVEGGLISYPPLFFDLLRRLSSNEIQFNEDLLPRHDQSMLGTEYVQISSDWAKKPWLSASLGNQAWRIESSSFSGLKPFEPIYHDIVLPSGIPARRVFVKTPVARFRSLEERRGFPSGSPPGRPAPAEPGSGRAARPQGGRPQQRVVVFGPLVVGVLVAAETVERDRQLDDLAIEMQDRLESQERESEETLRLLRRHLILISLSTFAATVVGCSLLVRLGLSPLRRLSEAVGRVSPSDFQLPINDATLPVELTPITGRLRVTLNELRKAFEREKHAAADISHELRTPVAALMTTLSVALKKTRSVDEYRQTLQDCQGIGRHLRQLVERVMALARLDSGVDRLRQRTVDLQDLAEQCAALVRPLAAERGIEVRVHCPKPVTWTVDADKLREVIINLMHNAVEYNRPRGAVDLTVQADGDTLDVQVHDTGVGIAPEAVEHVFERFYRADPSRQNSDLHAGLGLSIVKGYVELLGGSVTVSSVGGEGSTFRVRLPQTAPA